jgi:hypothetical protein
MSDEQARQSWFDAAVNAVRARGYLANSALGIAALIVPGADGVGERLTRVILEMLKNPQAREDLINVVKAGTAANRVTGNLQDFIEHAVIDRVAAGLGVPDARMRVALATSYLLGVATSRYVLRVEPLASATDEQVVRLVSPAIQQLLDPRAPLPGMDSA